jgi:NADP-dependent 3-hydroxy acid dehydrogenase YdfG
MNATGKPEVVVITGASAGVGRATAREFAKSGAYIGLLARGEDGLEATRAEIEAAGGKALVLPTDVADGAQVEAAAEAVEREFGPIDVWVNNAMVSVLAPFDQVSPEEFRRVTEVTYLGYVWGTMAALKRMRPRNRGSIVQVGSALAYRAIPLQAAYCGRSTRSAALPNRFVASCCTTGAGCGSRWWSCRGSIRRSSNG